MCQGQGRKLLPFYFLNNLLSLKIVSGSSLLNHIELQRSMPIMDVFLTGIQEVAGSILRADNILSRRLILKSFLLIMKSCPTANSSKVVFSYWQKDKH